MWSKRNAAKILFDFIYAKIAYIAKLSLIEKGSQQIDKVKSCDSFKSYRLIMKK